MCTKTDTDELDEDTPTVGDEAITVHNETPDPASRVRPLPHPDLVPPLPPILTAIGTDESGANGPRVETLLWATVPRTRSFWIERHARRLAQTHDPVVLISLLGKDRTWVSIFDRSGERRVAPADASNDPLRLLDWASSFAGAILFIPHESTPLDVVVHTGMPIRLFSGASFEMATSATRLMSQLRLVLRRCQVPLPELELTVVEEHVPDAPTPTDGRTPVEYLEILTTAAESGYEYTVTDSTVLSEREEWLNIKTADVFFPDPVRSDMQMRFPSFKPMSLLDAFTASQPPDPLPFHGARAWHLDTDQDGEARQAH